MKAEIKRALWAGRTAALLAIVLLGLNLRTAVTTISPIIDSISQDIRLDEVRIGVLGMLAPIAFAVSGLVAPAIARRVGLENALLLACVAMAIGPAVRAASTTYAALVIGGLIALAGMGVGNILLPPAVKKYFPDRVGLVTAAYATALSLSTAIPALLAAPMALALGWRFSVGVWGAIAISALIAWIIVRRQARSAGAVLANFDAVGLPVIRVIGQVWHSRVAWAIALIFASAAINAYTAFAWLPTILREVAGVSQATAGSLLALYAIVGLPLAVVIPGIAVRVRNVAPLVWVAAACLVVGYGGLMIAPASAPWLWVLLVSAGTLMFPLALVLINLRSRTPTVSASLSGFVQGFGYGVGALGPLIAGLLYSATGAWTAPLWFLLATAGAASVAGMILTRGVTVEDDLARRQDRTPDR